MVKQSLLNGNLILNQSSNKTEFSGRINRQVRPGLAIIISSRKCYQRTNLVSEEKVKPCQQTWAYPSSNSAEDRHIFLCLVSLAFHLELLWLAVLLNRSRFLRWLTGMLQSISWMRSWLIDQYWLIKTRTWELDIITESIFGLNNG